MSDITIDFIKATKKIHADVRAILTTLHLIREDVKMAREQSVGSNNAPLSNAQKSDSQRDPADYAPDSGSSSLKTGKPDGKKKDASDEHDGRFNRFKKKWWKTLKKPRFQLELAALIGLGIYTYETSRTNDLTEKSVKFQFVMARAQQRSYIELFKEPTWNSLKLEDIKELAFPIELKNVGHVAASKGFAELVLEFPYANQEPSFSYAGPHVGTVLPPMFPDATPQLIYAGILDGSNKPQAMSDDLRAELADGKRYLVVFGRITYEDMFSDTETWPLEGAWTTTLKVGLQRPFPSSNPVTVISTMQ